MKMLANYFQTTTDFLLLDEKKVSELQTNEKEWLQLFHQLSNHSKTLNALTCYL